MSLNLFYFLLKSIFWIFFGLFLLLYNFLYLIDSLSFFLSKNLIHSCAISYFPHNLLLNTLTFRLHSDVFYKYSFPFLYLIDSLSFFLSKDLIHSCAISYFPHNLLLNTLTFRLHSDVSYKYSFPIHAKNLLQFFISISKFRNNFFHIFNLKFL